MADGDDTISTEAACRLLGISDVWLRKIADQGYYTKVKTGRWNLVEVVQGYIRYLKDEERSATKTAAASRMQNLRADRMEREMQIQAHELVRRDDARHVMDFAAATLQAAMMQVPPRFTRNLEERERLESLLIEGISTAVDKIDDKLTKLETGSNVID